MSDNHARQLLLAADGVVNVIHQVDVRGGTDTLKIVLESGETVVVSGSSLHLRIENPKRGH